MTNVVSALTAEPDSGQIIRAGESEEWAFPGGPPRPTSGIIMLSTRLSTALTVPRVPWPFLRGRDP